MLDGLFMYNVAYNLLPCIDADNILGSYVPHHNHVHVYIYMQCFPRSINEQGKLWSNIHL